MMRESPDQCGKDRSGGHICCENHRAGIAVNKVRRMHNVVRIIVLASVLSEVLSSLVPLRQALSESVSEPTYIFGRPGLAQADRG